MSLNLHLGVKGGPECSLHQTPDSVSLRAARGDAKAAYFAWLDGLHEPPRAPSPRAGRVLFDEYRRKMVEHRFRLQDVAEHKLAVEDFLRRNPAAKWSCW